MKKVVILIMSVLIFLGCSSLRVNVDYDPSYTFVQQQSFAIVHNEKEGENTLLNDRITNALEQELKNKGYVKAKKDKADMVFVFHTDVQSKTDIHTDYVRVGYRGYRYGGGMVAQTSTYTYTKGTLIIDALTSKNKKIVWRAVTTDVLSQHDTPQERTLYINRVVKKTMKEFPNKNGIEK